MKLVSHNGLQDAIDLIASAMAGVEGKTLSQPLP
jgi:hypothetical protein